MSPLKLTVSDSELFMTLSNKPTTTNTKLYCRNSSTSFGRNIRTSIIDKIEEKFQASLRCDYGTIFIPNQRRWLYGDSRAAAGGPNVIDYKED